MRKMLCSMLLFLAELSLAQQPTINENGVLEAASGGELQVAPDDRVDGLVGTGLLCTFDVGDLLRGVERSLAVDTHVEQALDHLDGRSMVKRLSAHSLELFSVTGNLGWLLFVEVSRKTFKIDNIQMGGLSKLQKGR